MEENHHAVAKLPTFSSNDVLDQVRLVQDVMHKVMKEGHHHGAIPGTDKPTLLKPGAEKLCLTFRLAPRFKVMHRDLEGGHREYEVECSLDHITTGSFVGSGVGLCSSMESKYRWRNDVPACPECGMDLRRSKRDAEWYCWRKKGGCGATFPLSAIKTEGRVENPDIADTFNTVLKMAKKRALVDAVLTATAASDIFAQDLEDLGGPIVQEQNGPSPQQEPAQQASPPREQGGMTPQQSKMLWASVKGGTALHGEHAARFLKWVIQRMFWPTRELDEITTKDLSTSQASTLIDAMTDGMRVGALLDEYDVPRDEEQVSA